MNVSWLKLSHSHLEVEDSELDIPVISNYNKDQFKHSMQYWLTALGSAVGYGNIWRFPYVLFNNGGGAFFIPYFVWIVIFVFPLFSILHN